MVQSAISAPSGHNTQPWLFTHEKDKMIIAPDFKRALPAADPDNRELYISLGCAAENSMIAARREGFVTFWKIEETANGANIVIRLHKAKCPTDTGLYDCMHIRQTTRSAYSVCQPQSSELEVLNKTLSLAGIRLDLLPSHYAASLLTPFIKEANILQMRNHLNKKELLDWRRFSRSEARKKADGLYVKCSGVSPLGRSIGAWLMEKLINTTSEEKRLIKLLATTPLFAIISSEGDNVTDWITTGMSTQRLALKSTAMGLKHAYLNTPCQFRRCVRPWLRTIYLLAFHRKSSSGWGMPKQCQRPIVAMVAM